MCNDWYIGSSSFRFAAKGFSIIFHPLEMKHPPELSIIILCYRSGESIIELTNEVEDIVSRLGCSYELIL